MRIRAGIALLLAMTVLASSCGGRQYEDVVLDFEDSVEGYDLLHAMMVQESTSSQDDCKAVVGAIDDFWGFNTGPEVIGGDVPSERFTAYLNLLDQVDAQSIERCGAEGPTIITLDQTSTADCPTTVEIRNDFTIPEPTPNRHRATVIPLGDEGWYVNYFCL